MKTAPLFAPIMGQFAGAILPLPPQSAGDTTRMSRARFLRPQALRGARHETHIAVAAGHEGGGGEAAMGGNGIGRPGVILCKMTGGVISSRRFYEEIPGNPATASPLVFPETVFNAP